MSDDFDKFLEELHSFIGDKIKKRKRARAAKNFPELKDQIEYLERKEARAVQAAQYQTLVCRECGKPHGECDPDGVGHYRG